MSKGLETLRWEFGALEAPDMPEDERKDPDQYVDELWERLRRLVVKADKDY